LGAEALFFKNLIFTSDIAHFHLLKKYKYNKVDCKVKCFQAHCAFFNGTIAWMMYTLQFPEFKTSGSAHHSLTLSPTDCNSWSPQPILHFYFPPAKPSFSSLKG
jgi:hypothetical protein